MNNSDDMAFNERRACMSPGKYILHSISCIAFGSIITLIVFGLVLALLWALFPVASASKLIGALISAALALCAGGFILAWSSGGTNWLRPAVFGLLFGGVSFIYILGPVGNALLLAGASTLITIFGALLFRWVIKNGSP